MYVKDKNNLSHIIGDLKRRPERTKCDFEIIEK